MFMKQDEKPCVASNRQLFKGFVLFIETAQHQQSALLFDKPTCEIASFASVEKTKQKTGQLTKGDLLQRELSRSAFKLIINQFEMV